MEQNCFVVSESRITSLADEQSVLDEAKRTGQRARNLHFFLVTAKLTDEVAKQSHTGLR